MCVCLYICIWEHVDMLVYMKYVCIYMRRKILKEKGFILAQDLRVILCWLSPLFLACWKANRSGRRAQWNEINNAYVANFFIFPLYSIQPLPCSVELPYFPRCSVLSAASLLIHCKICFTNFLHASQFNQTDI